MVSTNKIVKSLEQIVGANWVYDAGSEEAAPYLARLGGGPEAVAMPGNVEELGAIVRSAGEVGYSLWVFPNAAGNGAMVGKAEGDIALLDLSRMNRIIEVNQDEAYALVEPGVSYKQLFDYLQVNHPGLWIDCDRNSSNSVAGSIYDREYGYTPYGDRSLVQCGMEIMLPDGDLLRTGMGALPKSNAWQLFKYGYGPYIDGLFTQSDLGIMTKVGLWLMPAPPSYKPFMVALQNPAMLAAAVEIMAPMKIHMAIGNTVIISSALQDAAPYAQRSEYIAGGRLDADAVARDFDLGSWNLYGALYGGPEDIALIWGMVEPALKMIEGATIFQDGDRPDDPVWRNRERIMRGVPADGMENLRSWQGDDVLSLGVTLPIAAADAMRVNGIVSEVLSRRGFDYLCEYAIAWRSMTKRVNLPFTWEGSRNLAVAEACAEELIANLAAAGYGVTHMTAGLRHRAMKSYTQGALSDLHGRLKAELDPKGVLTNG